ncbi:SoxR reducing system RseC family protein [Thiothrix subterranea]|uniref:SoxR reducing system RseC family protein n=1 Tax=Thiothrix subterranea TaxID=2735563 RepID=A0AA51MRG0_9GAMM|nr:SoxR reducing system RseC family protein [Thiothrix subterranea]MDQ5770151.1 SoxR reducing system RseC family protein [Thiothrix subterranea]WML88893.1 SoxR reducing system RseC family protein [Thiothrix subterranea]
MIEQTAVVVSVDSGHAWILPQQKSGGCSGCATKTTCSTSSPFDFLNKEAQKMRVLNPSYARPGDTVVVGVQGDALVAYSLLTYMLPLISLILMALLGRELLAFIGITSEWATIFSGMAGLFGGLRLANLVAARSFQSNDFQPVILRVVGQPLFTGITPLA